LLIETSGCQEKVGRGTPAVQRKKKFKEKFKLKKTRSQAKCGLSEVQTDEMEHGCAWKSISAHPANSEPLFTGKNIHSTDNNRIATDLN
jgi:hypothetical protein